MAEPRWIMIVIGDRERERIFIVDGSSLIPERMIVGTTQPGFDRFIVTKSWTVVI